MDASVQARERRPGNLRVLVGRRRLGEGLAAVGAGLLMSAAFAPLEWAWLAWIGLVPLLLVAVHPGRSRWWLGYLFGLAHFSTTFAWLAEVFLPAPVLLGAFCALFPAFWLAFAGTCWDNLIRPAPRDLDPRADPSVPPPAALGPWQECGLVLLLAAAWCSLEWVRSWAFSGLPWNQLGVSQWQARLLLPLTRFTGVYGLSFLVVAVNVSVWLRLRQWLRQRRGGPVRPRGYSRPLALAAMLLAVSMLLPCRTYRLGPPDARLRVAAAQGNIPQSRVYTPGQLELSIDAYLGLTRQIVAAENPDLVVWPETAIPAPLIVDVRCRDALVSLFDDIQTPVLAGSLDIRLPPGSDDFDAARHYNSALLFDADGRVVDWYDKIHLVPFGEYVPMVQLWPWLERWIGMGRGLTPGREYTVMPFGDEARIGTTICYEDVFPEISRRLVSNGANLIVGITNDAWYAESAGARQHFAHAVVRAAETLRPVLRSGNNSDTALIMPDGKVVGRLVNPDTGSPFYRGARVYTVPLWKRPPLTFYVRHGNWLAWLCTAVALAAAGWCFYRYLERRRRLLAMVNPPTD